jgi:hypothetical protein
VVVAVVDLEGVVQEVDLEGVVQEVDLEGVVQEVAAVQEYLEKLVLQQDQHFLELVKLQA